MSSQPVTDKRAKHSGASDRRRWRRIAGDRLRDVQTQLTSGGETWLVDLSLGGARIRTRTRMLPGLKITLKFSTPDGPVVVRGQIVRSALVNLPQGPPGYEIGVSFDEALTGPLAEAMKRGEASAGKGDPAAPASPQPAPEAPKDVVLEVESLIDNLKKE